MYIFLTGSRKMVGLIDLIRAFLLTNKFRTLDVNQAARSTTYVECGTMDGCLGLSFRLCLSALTRALKPQNENFVDCLETGKTEEERYD